MPISSHLARPGLRAAGLIALIGALALVAVGCGSDAKSSKAAASTDDAQTVSIKHAQGSTDVPVSPKKVVVFDMASLDSIDTLGAGSAVIGTPVESVPAYLKAYASEDMVNAGTLFEPDYEKVAAAKPDLIVVGGRSAAAYKELAKIAPTIDMTVDPTKLLDSVHANVTSLGDIFDAKDEAAAKLDELDASIERVAGAAKDAGTGLVILVSGGKLSAYGPGSRFGIIHDPLGVAPAKDDIKVEGPHGEAASFEYVLTANPDHLFVVDRDAVVSEPGVEAGPAAEKVLDNDIIKRTSAAKKGNIHYIDPTTWYIVGGGLTAYSQMVDEIGRAVGA